ncbi:MAG: PAS domain S-box protein [Planctomycetaceae bacterium]|nr:MAG: PAS domain S-box protein [Planctomycetaceae bacterium]
MDEQKTTVSLSGDFYRLLCENAAVALIATDAEFNIVSWNQAAGDLLGRQPDEMIGKSILDIVPANRRKLLDRLLRRTTQRGDTNQFEVHLPLTGGAEQTLMVVLSAVPTSAGKNLGVAVWIVDETNRRKMADRLTQAEKMASLGTLAGGVAHHFNNILGGVATFVDFALTSGDVTSMKRALQMTAEAAARAAKITQSLLSFAEHNTERTDMADLTEVVLTFVHLVERPLTERKIKMQLQLHPVPVIAVEANRMHQVLGNLLTNAEEAMPQGGTITISVDRLDSDVRLTFADSGAGIKKDHLGLVFEPFFTTKGLLAGGDKANPGLGLSVVHGIIVEMGGTISVESEPDQGAKFTMLFPISKSV